VRHSLIGPGLLGLGERRIGVLVVASLTSVERRGTVVG
jgi:hypothetical protein